MDRPSDVDVPPAAAGLGRRALLARALAVAAALGWGPAALARAGERSRARAAAPVGAGRVLTTEEWATLAAVQETLWPAGDGCPGARDLNATGVLDAVLADPDTPPIQLTWVRGALPTLKELAAARGAATFEALDAAGREAVLVAFRDRPEGSGWIRLVLGYTLEAVLGDPVHGGNVGEAGWTWAGYEPGDPRPPSKEPPK
ncbi:MAG: gluconate 2-dehydrogenase subunit 3 family protein [Planctomycetota bacterium]